MRGEGGSGTGGKFEIIVSTDETGDALQFAIPSITYVRLILDPSLLDQRQYPAKILKRCQRLVRSAPRRSSRSRRLQAPPGAEQLRLPCWKEDMKTQRSAREYGQPWLKFGSGLAEAGPPPREARASEVIALLNTWLAFKEFGFKPSASAWHLNCEPGRTP